jgi:hypothetical protein
MCFGGVNPNIASGTDNHDQSHTRTNDFTDQHYPNKPIKASEDGIFANSPYARSKPLREAKLPGQKAKDHEE